MRILELFSDSSPVLRVGEIARALDLPRSTAYRYVSALNRNGLLEQAPGENGYRLGRRIIELAASMSRKPLRELALPYMERVVRETGETVILCGLRGHVGVCLEKVDGHHALRVSFELGETYPLHAASSRRSGARSSPMSASAGSPKRRSPMKPSYARSFPGSANSDSRRATARRSKGRGGSLFRSSPHPSRSSPRSASPPRSIGVSAPVHRVKGEKRSQLMELLIDAGRHITRELNALEAR